MHDTVVDRERPRVTVDSTTRVAVRTPPPRPRAGLARRSNAAGSTSSKQVAGSTGSTSTVNAGAFVDRHAVLPPEHQSWCCQSTASKGSENAGHFCDPSGKSAGDSGRATSSDERADPRRDRPQRVEVEAVERGRVAGEHHLHLVRIDAGEAEPDRLLRERVARLLVRVVAAPHDPVDADLLADRDLGRADEARADVALAGPVLARLSATASRRRAAPLAPPASRPRCSMRSKK